MTKILPRSTWDKSIPIGPSAIYPTGPAQIVWLHNTAGEVMSINATQMQECLRIDGIQRYHTNPKTKGGRGWSDIAYSFMVAPSGRGYTCRGYLRQHGANLGESNRDSISICLLGNYDIQKPTQAQIEMVQYIIQNGLDTGAIVKSYSLLGHRDEPAPKTCPGNNITTYAPFKPTSGGSEDMAVTDEEFAALVEKVDKQGQDIRFLVNTIKNWKAAGWDAGGISEHLGTELPAPSSLVSGTLLPEDLDDAEHPE